jgi:hypothetical protein
LTGHTVQLVALVAISELLREKQDLTEFFLRCHFVFAPEVHALKRQWV